MSWKRWNRSAVQDRCDVLERVSENLPLDDERRSEPDHLAVRLLGQDAALLECLAIRPSRAGRLLDLDADQEPLAAHLGHVRRADAAQLAHEPAAQLVRAPGQVL